MSREQAINAFLIKAGWDEAERVPVPGDASSRRYERLALGERRAVLMDAPPAAETPSEPDGASAEDRAALGYNAAARLAGNNSDAFVSIANELTTRGFSAPKIIAADFDAGFMLLEDLGDDLFARVIETDPTLEDQLYAAAADTLAAIYRSTFPAKFSYRDRSWAVRAYDDVAMLAEVGLMLDWFAPEYGAEISGKARAEWTSIWQNLFTRLKAHAPGLALRDFHAENLFWLPERQAVERVGLIDFQDGLFAHPAYDLVSFLQDARRDVRRELEERLINRFCEKAGIPDDQTFRAAYRIIGAQRNAKILGIFIRLARRDGKDKYLDLIPRVARLFVRDLEAPELWPLKSWLENYIPGVFKIMPQIKTAMVMAAGHGTRMRPLTDDRSKAMVEVGGKPLIDHMLDRLSEAGVTRVIVNVHAHADHLENHLKSLNTDLEIIISDEREKLLETGGGVVKALPLLGHDPILICNIDAIWTENAAALKYMIAAWDPTIMDDLLLLAPIGDTLGYHGKGDFDLSEDGHLSRRSGETAPYVYAGVQIARLDPVKPFPIEKFSRNKIWDISLEKSRIFGHVLEGFWMHIGDPVARDEAEGRLKSVDGG